jgi:hypothetical protein
MLCAESLDATNDADIGTHYTVDRVALRNRHPFAAAATRAGRGS